MIFRDGMDSEELLSLLTKVYSFIYRWGELQALSMIGKRVKDVNESLGKIGGTDVICEGQLNVTRYM